MVWLSIESQMMYYGVQLASKNHDFLCEDDPEWTTEVVSFSEVWFHKPQESRKWLPGIPVTQCWNDKFVHLPVIFAVKHADS